MRKIRAFLADQRGATAIEYGLLVTLLGIIIVTGISALDLKLYNAITNLTNAIK